MGGGENSANSVMPVRASCIAVHAFGLGAKGRVSTHATNLSIVALSATYEHEMTSKLGGQLADGAMRPCDWCANSPRMDRASGRQRTSASPGVVELGSTYSCVSTNHLLPTACPGSAGGDGGLGGGLGGGGLGGGANCGNTVDMTRL